jgi:hypothetical protein
LYYDLTQAQHEQLLKGLHGSRVAKRTQSGRSLSYLEAWDVKAHMNRIFGFTGWSWNVTSAEVAFEGIVLSSKGSENWNVGYKVIGTLSVAGATYTEAAVGAATLPARGDAHDMAVKTAESDAFKRAAINLGDQFGLSLYNNGSTAPVVKGTLYSPEIARDAHSHLREAVERTLTAPDLEVVPVEAAVSDSEALSEPEAASHGETADSPAPAAEEAAPAISDEEAEVWAEKLRECITEGDVPGIVKVKAEMASAGIMPLLYKGKTFAKLVDLSVVAAGKNAAKKGLGATEVDA